MSTPSAKTKAPKFEIAGLAFRTRKDLENHIREIVNRYKDGDMVNNDDKKFLVALFDRHPDADEKIGDGVSSIEVRTNRTLYGTSRGFHIHRADGSSIDISWVTCIEASRSPQKDFERAARCEIASQRQKFRDAFFVGKPVVICPLTKQPILRAECQVDHVKPKTFQALATQWLQVNHLRPEDIKTTASPNGLNDVFCDRALAASWQQFHEEHAELRVVSRKGNLSIARKSAG